MENSEKKLVCIEGKSLESIQNIINHFERQIAEKEQFQIAAQDLRSFLTEKFENEDELNTALDLLGKQLLLFLESVRKKHGWSPRENRLNRKNQKS